MVAGQCALVGSFSLQADLSAFISSEYTLLDMQRDATSQLASLLGVTEDRIVITSISSGSIVVEFLVLPSADPTLPVVSQLAATIQQSLTVLTFNGQPLEIQNINVSMNTLESTSIVSATTTTAPVTTTSLIGIAVTTSPTTITTTTTETMGTTTMPFIICYCVPEYFPAWIVVVALVGFVLIVLVLVFYCYKRRQSNNTLTYRLSDDEKREADEDSSHTTIVIESEGKVPVELVRISQQRHTYNWDYVYAEDQFVSFV